MSLTDGNKPWKDFNVPVPWGVIAGREYGDAAGEPWISVHGWLDNCGSFQPLARCLEPLNPRLICIDCPGHGWSSHYPPGMSYDVMDSVSVLRRVVDFFGLTKVSLLGHSLGAIYCFLFAAVHPDMTRRLVMLDSVAPTPRHPEAITNKIRQHVEDFLKNEALSAVKPPKRHQLESARARMMEGLTSSLGKANMTKEAMECLEARALRKMEDQVDSYLFTRDMRLYAIGGDFHLTKDVLLEFAKQIKCPHLVLVSDLRLMSKERRLALSPIMEVMGQKDKFRYVEIDATHHVHLTDPRRVAEIIIGFVANVSE